MEPEEQFVNAESAAPSDIDAYIAGFPMDVQQRLEQTRGLILEIAPDAVQSISYAIPTFKLNRRRWCTLQPIKSTLVCTQSRWHSSSLKLTSSRTKPTRARCSFCTRKRCRSR